MKRPRPSWDSQDDDDDDDDDMSYFTSVRGNAFFV
jgi:hypothetical protein